MPDTVLTAAFQIKIAVRRPTAVAEKLGTHIEAWRHRAAELQAPEDQLLSQMPPPQGRGSQEIALAAVQQMLQSLNCPDVKIADESAVGFNDDIPESGVFEARTTDNGVKGQSRGLAVAKGCGRQVHPGGKLKGCFESREGSDSGGLR